MARWGKDMQRPGRANSPNTDTNATGLKFSGDLLARIEGEGRGYPSQPVLRMASKTSPEYPFAARRSIVEPFSLD